MTIYVSNDISKEFLLTTLKECYLMYLQSELFNNKIKKQSLELMNKYLIDNYKIDLKKLFKSIIENILVTTQGDDYKLTVNDHAIIIKNYTLGMLMRLVDYGNTDIKGLHVFDKVEKYIQSRLDAIFTIHTLKGLQNNGN